MSSSTSPSRRSTRSGGPKWRRTLSSSKSQQPASISLVFAQPEQGSRLRSAVEQLPTLAVDDSSSSASIMSKKRERLQSTSTTGRDERADEDRKRTRTESGVVPSNEILVSSPSDNIIPTITEEESRRDPPVLSESPKSLPDPLPPRNSTQYVPFPTTTEPDPAGPRVQEKRSRTSWFGSLSRARGREQSLPSEAQAPTALVQEFSHPATLDMSPKSATGAALPLSTSFPTQPSASPPGPSTSQLQETNREATGADAAGAVESPSISSIDEEVPQPRLAIPASGNSPPTTAVVHSQSDDALAMGRKPSITSLNPSTSRFTLRMPLLGRPKVPLQQAVANAEGNAEDIASRNRLQELRGGDAGTQAHNGDMPPPPPARPIANDETTIAADPTVCQESSVPPESSSDAGSPERSAQSMDDTTPKASAHAPTVSSWWDYVGWSRHGSSSDGQDTAVQEIPKADPPQVLVEIAPSPAPEMPIASTKMSQATLSSPTVASSSSTAETTVSRHVPEQQTNPQKGQREEPIQPSRSATDQKPPSVFSGQTSKSQGSAWYSPWAWYGMSPNPADSGGDANLSNPDGTDRSGDSGTGEPVKTDAEIIKERALAREEASPDVLPTVTVTSERESASQEKLEALREEPKNPIESSIISSRSGWMNFLMSRALLTKTITSDEIVRDENGMEVMDVEEDGSHPEGSNPGAPPAEKPAPEQLQAASSSQLPVLPPRHEHKKSLEARFIPPVKADGKKGDVTKRGSARSPSPSPSNVSGVSSATSPRPSPSNLVLPTWEDTFLSPPRSNVPPKPRSTKSKLTKTLSMVSGVLFSKDDQEGKGKGKERERAAEFINFGRELPKALDAVGEQLNPYLLNGGCRVAVIGVAGWSPGAVTRTLAGGLPSSSSKFVDMTCQALERFSQEHNFKFKKVTRIALEGDGTIERKLSKIHDQLLGDDDWMEDLHAADVIFVACHSQGCIVGTHLIDRLLRDGHILTSRSVDTLAKTAASIAPGSSSISSTQAQRICFLALCGIHLGPLRYLGTSSLLQPYLQYFENAAARELFEFQNTESRLSKNYVRALNNVMDHGTKMVYIASLNDQVVPVYSGLFTAAAHPRILRAVYIDGDAYHSSDFLSNLLVLLIRIMNAGLSDGGLLNHLSEATAGTLSGVGHSSIYEELATFSLAVKYFFLTTDGDSENAELSVGGFNAAIEQNDYEIPWALRDMIADERVAHFFAREFSQLRDAFDDWQPKTTILRDVKKKLQPIQRLTSFTSPVSKL